MKDGNVEAVLEIEEDSAVAEVVQADAWVVPCTGELLDKKVDPVACDWVVLPPEPNGAPGATENDCGL